MAPKDDFAIKPISVETNYADKYKKKEEEQPIAYQNVGGGPSVWLDNKVAFNPRMQGAEGTEGSTTFYS